MISKVVYFIAALALVQCMVDTDHYNSYSFTFILPPKQDECFYHEFKAGQSIFLEFQVIAGGEGDVDFTLDDPNGESIESYRKTGEETITVDETEAGEYVFCFDNSFSSYTSKTVFFELIHEGVPMSMSKDAPDPKAQQMTEDALARMEVVDHSLVKIWNGLTRVVYFQSMFRAYEARDKWMLEFKFRRINFWSTVNIFVMIAVFLLQVYTVKRMLTVSTARK